MNLSLSLKKASAAPPYTGTAAILWQITHSTRNQNKQKKQAGPPQLPIPLNHERLACFFAPPRGCLKQPFPLRSVRIPPVRTFCIIGNSEEFLIIKDRSCLTHSLQTAETACSVSAVSQLSHFPGVLSCMPQGRQSSPRSRSHTRLPEGTRWQSVRSL